MSGEVMSGEVMSGDSSLADFAAEVGADDPVAVVGGRTRWEVGGEPAADPRLVNAPAGITEYVPEEMTVTVRAGTATAELAAELAAKGQRTGLPERGGTVGGSLAVGQNHLEVLGRGTVRSSLLQVRYISAEGRIVTGGGPTVKNVTGFDLPRLMVGSLGTLGFLAEVILRTNPIPAVRQWYESSDARPAEVIDALLAPSAVLWDGSSTSVLLEGHAPDVADQRAQLDAVGTFAEREPVAEPTGHRWSVTPADLGHLHLAATGAFVASMGVGTVWAENPQPPRPVSAAVKALNERVKAQFDPTGRLNPGRDPMKEAA